MSQPDIPAYADLLWPTIVAVRRLGGSGSIDEIAEAVVDQEGFTEEQQQVLHGDGPQTEIEYRLLKLGKALVKLKVEQPVHTLLDVWLR